MDEAGFITAMKKDKKSGRAIQAHVAGTRAFETHLAQAGKTLETATLDDLRSYTSRGEVDIFGIWCYYEYTDNVPMYPALQLSRHPLYPERSHPFRYAGALPAPGGGILKKT